MIIGIGTDIIDIRRIEKVIARHGARFTERIYTVAEREKSENRRNTIESYAKRFAAKEACAKALGTGLLRKGVFFHDIGVVNAPGGQPTLELTGGARRILDALLPAGHDVHFALTLTDEPPLAQATVIISAVPAVTGLPAAR